jgi:phospholipid/cholesterol/gamma-HCH transport system ATP-binding protein
VTNDSRMISPAAILQFKNVTIESGANYETGLANTSLELNPGELLLVRIERENERLPLADAALGLVTPDAGTVSLRGQDWKEMSADHAAEMRGKIGRLFEDEAWISDMDVDENITLSERHHTLRSDSDILEEALNLAKVFGLPGLPRGRPDKMRRWDLRKAACIRAFLGQPFLVILEQPERGVYADLVAALIHAVQSVRKRGAAVLWTVTDPTIWNHPAIHPTRRSRMVGFQLCAMESES